MSQYNTGNPVPSSDMRDVWDNNSTIDIFVSSPELKITTRAGIERDTLSGIQKKAEDQRDQIALDGAAVIDETRQNLIPLSRQYMTLADAQADIANIPEGSATYYRSPDDSALAIEVINNGGTLEATGRMMPSQKAVKEVSESLLSIPVRPVKVPIIVDDAGNVPVWLVDGDLAVRGVSDGFAELLDGRVQGKGTENFTSPDSKVPLFVDDAGNVPLWLINGNLAVRGLDQSLVNLLSGIFNSAFQLRESPLTATKPIATDGRTLFKFKSKLGRVIDGVNTTARIMFTGDSWTEYVAIPQAMYNLCQEKYGVTNSSYISVNGQFMLNSTTFAKSSGWALYDASAVTTGPGNGCGPDGQSISTTASDQTVTITNQPCTQVNILYQDLDGTFRYRIDGGSWTVVAGGSTGVMKRLIINSLADTLHNIEIDTTGNTGMVALHGFWCPRSAGGVEIMKCGNAGITGRGITNYYDQIQQYANFMQPDLVFVILGTNDFRTSTGTASYVEGLQNLVGQYKAAYPETGIVLISPARCNATGNPPSSAYRDAMANLAMELGVEFFNFHDDWDTWVVMNKYGVWVDSLHLNDSGAAGLAKSLDRHFISL
ncbi:TPA: SGNH/GDSL hydrolase family protein [Klebsiella aerogenes]